MGKRTILVVEDELIVALEIKKTLLKLGYEVVGTEKDGMSAIETAGRTMPDLILMDIRLKGDMDGIEAAGRIRSLYQLPVIFLTAHSDEDTLSRALKTHPCGYLVKPFRERELYQSIEMGIHKFQVLRKTSPGWTESGPSPLEGIGSPALLLRDDGKVHNVNSAFTGLTGLSACDCANRSLASVLGQHRRQANSTLPDQMVIRCREGGSVPVSAKLGFLSVGGSTQPLITFLEKTDTHQTTGRHLTSGATQPDLQVILDALYMPVFVVGDDFRICYFNQRFGNLMRCARISNYLLTRPVYEIERFSLFGSVDEFRDVMRSGDVSTRVRRFTKAGKELVYQFAYIPMESGGRKMVTTVIHDLNREGLQVDDTRRAGNDPR